MADIFISYSKKDHDLAQLLAARLQAEGYSVWWDTSLLSGENFRRTIMTELGRARTAIVIWTENSINSDWVLSEAGRAHAERKLIPVKARSLKYEDIPPPFDNMHIENVEEHDKIIDAVVAALAKPAEEPSAFRRLSGLLQYELLSWFGIVGGAVTLATNLQGAITLSIWVRQFFEVWQEVLRRFWSTLFFFLPRVGDVDSVILTLIAVMILNLALASRRATQEDVLPARLSRANIAIAVPAAIIFAVFVAGLLAIFFSNAGTEPDALFVFFGDLARFFVGLIEPWQDIDDAIVAVFAIAISAALIVVLIPIGALLYGLGRAFGLRIDRRALTIRSWRIVIAIALVMVVNQVALWIEGPIQ